MSVSTLPIPSNNGKQAYPIFRNVYVETVYSGSNRVTPLASGAHSYARLYRSVMMQEDILQYDLSDRALLTIRSVDGRQAKDSVTTSVCKLLAKLEACRATSRSCAHITRFCEGYPLSFLLADSIEYRSGRAGEKYTYTAQRSVL